LSLQLFCGVLLSLLAAVATFILLFISSNQLLDQTVYGEPFMGKMANKKFESLKEYVNDRSITPNNMIQLNVWCKRGERLYLTIYAENQLIYSFPSSGEWDNDDEDESDLAIEDSRKEYELTLSDGTTTHAFLYYYAGDAYYYWTIVVSGIAAFVVFSLCFISFVKRKLQYVKLLKEELDILAGGDLNYPVKVIGQDELGELAFGIDQMRMSILNHQAVEDEIRSSNSKLVTAMSHDLRTPLTSLLAYLELLDREKYETREQMKHFVKRSLGQAMRIKTMADQLFEYFLVYSSEWEQPDLEPTDADSMFQQILGEYAFSLESQDYSVLTEFESLQGQVAVNLRMIRRVFDNLYSNLLKYADKSSPIRLQYKTESWHIILTVKNIVSPERSERESTNLGLNTCRRIMQYHNGGFEASEQEGIFQITLSFPLFYSTE
jgi:signal transduction histidine kinase